MKKKEKQQEPGIIQAEKPVKKSHKKRNIIIAVAVLCVISLFVDEPDDNAAASSAQPDKSAAASASISEPALQSEPAPESEPEPIPEPQPQPEPDENKIADAKAAAHQNDIIFHIALKYSRVYFNNLTKKISAMGNGTVSIEELYLYCDDVIKYTTSFQERTAEITDESAGDYKAANNMYIWNIRKIAQDLQKYIIA